MTKNKTLLLSLLATGLTLASCEIDRLPESEYTDVQFWNTENDLMNAANRMYQQLDANWVDNRGDDAVNQSGPNQVSNGSVPVPNTSGNWNDRYDEIFTANNILIKSEKAQVSEAVLNRYKGEACFFRAYAYSQLVKIYGDVPLLLKTLDFSSPELKMPRTPRAEVMAQIYADLDFAAQWLPTRAALVVTQYGRVTKSSAWALKARMGLYEGTRLKFSNQQGWQEHLQAAVAAAENVMAAGHTLFASFGGLFNQPGEGAANTENILVKIFGVDNTNVILGHNNSRDLENGRMAPTRNLLRQFLYSDGLPAFTTEGNATATRSPLFIEEGNEAGYNTILDNRDPRLAFTVFRSGEEAYKGPWVPTTSLGARSGFAAKKGFNVADQTINNGATVDRILIRFGEVLLTFAEAKFELNESISDEDLELSVNRLRTRVGFPVKLTNAFVTGNGLDMREEIRRERTVELALEGFRYDDLIRWRKAEAALPKDLLGAKYVEVDWPNTNAGNFLLNPDRVIIAEPAANRSFRTDRDYLYPIPLNEISLSGGSVIQNPNWQ
ncbi:MAG: RagB/SusD family nutrient uptake outer membrane protein [Chitinophagaceae bacterium]|nr:MAG: RagB/SusD family nutrient uptake outer membrane protein [Chitinophagaceae bacterium]